MKLMVGRPCGWQAEHPDVGTYLSQLMLELSEEYPRDLEVVQVVQTGARIMVARNEIVKSFLDGDSQYLLMVDPDMQPDLEAGHRFFWTSLNFLETAKNGIVGAPACSGPPHYNVNVFWVRWDGLIHHVTQNQASRMRGIERVAAVGTGVMLIPREIFSKLEPPWFEDEYLDQFSTRLKMSQDVAFSMKCNRAGVPVFVNWSCWAGHWKQHLVGRPNGISLPVVL